MMEKIGQHFGLAIEVSQAEIHPLLDKSGVAVGQNPRSVIQRLC
jgi:hypothetical protein